MKFGHSVVINRPVDEVFAVAGNPDNDPQWGSLIVESRQVSAGPVDNGATFEQVATFLGGRITAVIEVTGYEPNRLIRYKTTPPIQLEHCRVFEAVQDGTRLTFSNDLDTEGRFKMAESLLSRIAQRQVETDLSALKNLLEAGA